ncbi:MAG: DUF3169 family protein [Clostridiales bacterium]|nr:DUF3169 family protein [Clostridiales bacterium]
MNDTVKRDNRKSLPLFLLVILLSAALGAVAGFFSAMAVDRGALNMIWTGLDRLMGIITPWAIPVCSAALLIPGFYLYWAAKKNYAVWDQESENVYQRIEDQLSYALLLSSLVVLTDLFFLAAGFLYADILTNALCFLVSMGLMMVLQQKVVDQTRQMNPEKQGSIYDVNFQKKWLESCDELERAQIGQASFRAYKVANSSCAAIWIVLVILSLVTDIGLLPILVVMLLWGVLQVSYTLECIRISHRRFR